MKQELQNKLFATYPKIFRQKDLKMSETCMCWGIETPDSWYNVLNILCFQIQTYCDSHPYVKQVEAFQVKEKFGYLRFYTNYEDEAISRYIEQAEEATTKICADCGGDIEVKPTSGWIVYLCEFCRRRQNGKR